MTKDELIAIIEEEIQMDFVSDSNGSNVQYRNGMRRIRDRIKSIPEEPIIEMADYEGDQYRKNYAPLAGMEYQTISSVVAHALKRITE
jgi:hypothetical protein